MDPSVFARRRQAVFDRLEDGVMVLPAAPVLRRSRDTELRYRADSELYYLTGVVEPEALLVLVGGETPRCVLFVRPRDAVAELWAGPRMGPEGASRVHGIEECHATDAIAEELPAMLRQGTALHYRPGRVASVDSAVEAALEWARDRGARRGDGPRSRVDPGQILDDLRLRKDESEIARMRIAARISMDGHRAAARAIREGRGEWEVEAAVNGAFRAGGGSGPGFPTIVGSGTNACVLHYVENHSRIPDGSLVLVDAGAEYGLYQGDISRTYPASGRFSDMQRDVYAIVNEARSAGIAAAAPGGTLAAVHDAAVVVIVQGLIDLGALQGEASDRIEDGSYRDFFPHQTSHWLGIDVHDPGDYARGGVARVLEPGMTFTVEPGLYFRPGVGGEGAERYAGIGVRVEDDVLVRESDVENLTEALPTSASEVEEWMEQSR